MSVQKRGDQRRYVNVPGSVNSSTYPQSQATCGTPTSWSRAGRTTRSIDPVWLSTDNFPENVPTAEDYLTPISDSEYYRQWRGYHRRTNGELFSRHHTLLGEIKTDHGTENLEIRDARLRVSLDAWKSQGESRAVGNPRKRKDIETKILNNPRAPTTTCEPPSRSCTIGNPHDTSTRNETSSSTLPPAFYISNPLPEPGNFSATGVDTDEGLDDTSGFVGATSKAESFPASIFIHRANSVIIGGTECQTLAQRAEVDAVERQTASTKIFCHEASNGSTLYQTWPIKADGAHHVEYIVPQSPPATRDVTLRRSEGYYLGPKLPRRPAHEQQHLVNYANPSYFARSSNSITTTAAKATTEATNTKTEQKKKKPKKTSRAFALLKSLKVRMGCCAFPPAAAAAAAAAAAKSNDAPPEDQGQRMSTNSWTSESDDEVYEDLEPNSVEFY